MKTINDLLSEYSQHHQNPTNKSIHWICVPLIMFSSLGILYSFGFPHWATDLFPLFSYAFMLVLFSFGYYFLKSFPISIGMLIIGVLMLWVQDIIVKQIGYRDLFILNAVIFVIAWIGQTIGHRIEGKKPSFMKDLQFLLIGPAWLLGNIYKKWHMNLDV